VAAGLIHAWQAFQYVTGNYLLVGIVGGSIWRYQANYVVLRINGRGDEANNPTFSEIQVEP